MAAAMAVPKDPIEDGKGDDNVKNPGEDKPEDSYSFQMWKDATWQNFQSSQLQNQGFNLKITADPNLSRDRYTVVFLSSYLDKKGVLWYAFALGKTASQTSAEITGGIPETDVKYRDPEGDVMLRNMYAVDEILSSLMYAADREDIFADGVAGDSVRGSMEKPEAGENDLFDSNNMEAKQENSAEIVTHNAPDIVMIHEDAAGKEISADSSIPGTRTEIVEQPLAFVSDNKAGLMIKAEAPEDSSAVIKPEMMEIPLAADLVTEVAFNTGDNRSMAVDAAAEPEIQYCLVSANDGAVDVGHC